MQVLRIHLREDLTLAALRRQHREHEFGGPCVVVVAPHLYRTASNLPGFVTRNDYRSTTPIDSAEIGYCELFHFMLAGPAVYGEHDV